MALVSLADAKTALHLTVPEVDEEVGQYLVRADALVLAYIHPDEIDETWTDATDPNTDRGFAIVQLAITMVLANLWRHRNDGADTKAPAALSDNVQAILTAAGLRRPGLA